MAEVAPSPVTNFAQYEAQSKAGTMPAEPKAPEAPAPAEPEPQEEPAPEPELEPAAAAAIPKKPLLREVTEMRRERRELQQPAAPSKQEPAAPPAAAEEKAPERPKLSTFQGSLEDYEKAVEEYEGKQRAFLLKEWDRKQVADQAKAAQQKVMQEYGTKLAEHLKAHPEYDAEVAQTTMSPLMVEIVIHHGPDLGQALIDNKEDAKRISALPRDVQIFEMGKLAARFSNGHAPAAQQEEEPEPEPVKVPSKIGPATVTASSIALNKPGYGAKTFAEYEAISKQVNQRLKQRR